MEFELSLKLTMNFNAPNEVLALNKYLEEHSMEQLQEDMKEELMNVILLNIAEDIQVNELEITHKH